MRLLVGLFVAVTSIVIVGMVSRYGYNSAEDLWDRYLAAVLFGTVAAGGLGGHAVAVRVWRASRGAALFVGLIAFAALLVNLSNSLGAIAGRGDKTVAERQRAADERADLRSQLKRLEQERGSLVVVVAVTEKMLETAETTLKNAERVEKLECDRRGQECRKRETETIDARSKLASLTAAMAMDKRAGILDGQIEGLRKKFEGLQVVGKADPQADLIARMFKLPDVGAAATAQQLAIAIVVELLIVGALVAYEMLGKVKRGAQKLAMRGETGPVLVGVATEVATTPALAAPAAADPVPEVPTAPDSVPVTAPEIVPEIVPEVAIIEPALPKSEPAALSVSRERRAKAKRAARDNEPRSGSPSRVAVDLSMMMAFAGDCLFADPAGRVAFEDWAAAFEAWCRATRGSPDMSSFGAALAELWIELGLHMDGESTVGVKLTPLRSVA